MRVSALALALIALIPLRATALIDSYSVVCKHPSHGKQPWEMHELDMDPCIEGAAHAKAFPGHRPQVFFHPDEGPDPKRPKKCRPIPDVKQACREWAEYYFARFMGDLLDAWHPMVSTHIERAQHIATEIVFARKGLACYGLGEVL